MIDIQRATEVFINYTKNYDLKDENIKRKQEHSIRVMNIMEKLAKNLQLGQEDVELAKLIGLLHDVGRFEQYKKYKTFKDHLSVDHANIGAEILFDENKIKEYTEDAKEYELIRKAIKNHNKYELKTEELSEREEVFCKLIKDADKIDIMFEGVYFFWKGKEKECEQQKISDKVYESFINNNLIENTIKQTNLDQIVGIISFIYDFNFKYSYEYIKEKSYIKRILERFNFKDEETKIRFKEIQEIANKNIEQKLK